uniref:Transposase n=1 Tax=Chenopodium quinoa TaxID=63459 RepID=A0A803MRU9_CHEQI
MHVGGETGSQWIHRMLTGHHNLCKEQLRLSREIFISLANFLRAQQLLTDGTVKHIHIEEQLGIDCVGAIDGTLIHAVVANVVGKAYIDRKGDKSWNVMAVCSHNMLFTHINVGYEGSAHDNTVWKQSLGDVRMGFPHPPLGKYYVVDSAYPNTHGYMSLHTGHDLRYHLPDFKRTGPP